MGKNDYYGKICEKHPELNGLRRGRNRECRGCIKERMALWRANNKEHIKASITEYRGLNREKIKVWAKRTYWANREERLKANKDWRDTLKAEVINHYGGVCQRCGVDDIDVLCIDHIGGGGNEHRRTTTGGSGQRTYSWLKSNNFPVGYRTLCHNCNIKVHILKIRADLD